MMLFSKEPPRWGCRPANYNAKLTRFGSSYFPKKKVCCGLIEVFGLIVLKLMPRILEIDETDIGQETLEFDCKSGLGEPVVASPNE